MDSVVHSFAFVYSFSLCVPPEIKDPEGRNEPQPARRTSSQREFAAVQPSGNLQIQIHAIKDRAFREPIRNDSATHPGVSNDRCTSIGSRAWAQHLFL